MENVIFRPGRIGPVELRNRTIRSAAFEGMGRDNNPTQMLRAYHESVALGGVGMTTLAYASVSRSGLSFDTQLWLRPEIEEPLRTITDAIHRHGAKASIQIGHCGNMTHRTTAGCIPVGACSGFNLYSPTIVRGLKRNEIESIADDFGKAVASARHAGFDCVEVHAGHGYLLSQFLSPYTNRRRDEFGGTLKNRLRFTRMAMQRVMEAAGNDMGVLVKMNMDDGFRSGMHEEECLEVAAELLRCGAHALVLSGGFVSKAPMYVMRGSMPVYSMTYYMRQLWLKYSVRMFGNMMIRKAPFRPLYFLEQARRFRKAFPDATLVYVGGVTQRREMEQVLGAEGFDFLQMGRALLRDPALMNHIAAGAEGCDCDHVNYCIARMYSREMACHKDVYDELPCGIRREIERIKRKAHRDRRK